VATAPATLSAHRMSGFARSLVALAIFGATVFLALKLRAIAAGVAIGALLLGMLAILGRYLAPSTAVEIVFLAMSMTALFSILESLLEVVKEWRHGKGWRVLLKPSTKTPLEAVKR
jgi:hypothetical protein